MSKSNQNTRKPAAPANNLGIPTSSYNKSLAAASSQQPEKSKDTPYNILFILTDQERYIEAEALPPGFHLPGRERLKKRGVNFTNHQINTAVCTSSRSVIYTGQHIQQTKMFDNLNFPWTEDLSPEIPTLGHLLSDAGYYTAYKGKWHLSDLGDLGEQALPDPELTKIIERYGFKDYVGIGDVIGMVQGGWINDELIAAQACRWLRVQGNTLNQQHTPWFLAVNLVNPHDVMFYNTDAPGQHIQDTPMPLIGLSHAPNNAFYKQQWDITLPKSRQEPFDKKGRPAAHLEYQRARDTQVGGFPNEDERWQRLLNYYHNCILSTDQRVMSILDELEDLGLADTTIVVLTSDHGELGGGHGNHGKGTTAYQEQNHVPMIISHPDYRHTQGQSCQAVTSHLDIAPTMLAWAHAQPQTAAKLPGNDLTPLLERGEQAGLNEVREGSLYCFNMFAYLDSNLLTSVQSFLNTPQDTDAKANPEFEIDFSKRGAIRSVFDGRYKFSRYFSPKQHNRPESIETLFKLNDVELFDLQNDPEEMDNLATQPETYQALLLAMNAKLNKLLDTEVEGEDDGSHLPVDKPKWAASEFGWY